MPSLAQFVTGTCSNALLLLTPLPDLWQKMNYEHAQHKSSTRVVLIAPFGVDT
jgi:hypothetical protein